MSLPRQIEFYAAASSGGVFGTFLAGEGDKQAPRKRLQQSDVRMVGVVPVAHRVMVESPGAATKTSIEVVDVKLNQGLADDLFDQRQLERGGN